MYIRAVLGLLKLLPDKLLRSSTQKKKYEVFSVNIKLKIERFVLNSTLLYL